MPKPTSFDLFVGVWNHRQHQDTPLLHVRMARFLAKGWRTHRRRLLLQAFRGSGKSTVTGLFCAWLLAHNPDLRILVVAADDVLATRLVRHVRHILENHPQTTHLLPTRKSEWAADRLTVQRPGAFRDPSLRASGITANITGSRADIIICDDVEVPNTCDSADKRQSLRQRLNELDFILTPHGMIVYIGTPHHEDSLYKDKGFLQHFDRLILPIHDRNGIPLWPERFPQEIINTIAQTVGPRIFASQMLLKPMSLDDAHLAVDALLYSKHISSDIALLAYWDPAFGHEQGDDSIVIIGGRTPDNMILIADCLKLCVKLQHPDDAATQQIQAVLALIAQHAITRILIEQNGLGQFLPGLLRKALQQQGLSCAVIPIRHHQAKNTRILLALEPVLAARKLVLMEKLRHSFLLQQWQDWRPDKTHQKDDALDALAGLVMALRRPAGPHRTFMAHTDFTESFLR